MIVEFVLKEGYDVEGLIFLLIMGGDGNIEFLIYLKWYGECENGENYFLIFIE